MARKISNAQVRALTLIKSGSYSYDAGSGSVRHRLHRPGTPIVNARTWASLAGQGLVEYDDLTYGLAKITDTGREALAARKEA